LEKISSFFIYSHNNQQSFADFSPLSAPVTPIWRSNRCIVESSFSPDFLTTFLNKDFDVSILIDELVSTFFIEEDPKTYEEVMGSIDVSF